MTNDTDPVTSTEAAAQDFLQFMTGFYQQFNDLQFKKLVLTGESYAGHYIPAFAKAILDAGDTLDFKLTAIACGDGLTDAMNQLRTYADVAYVNGFIDKTNRLFLQGQQGLAYEACASSDYGRCEDVFAIIPGFVTDLAGDFNVYNWRQYTSSAPGADAFIPLFYNQSSTMTNFGFPTKLAW